MNDTEQLVLKAALAYGQAQRLSEQYASENPSPRRGDIKMTYGKLRGRAARRLNELQNACMTYAQETQEGAGLTW